MADYIEEATDAGVTERERKAWKASRLRHESNPARIAKGLAPGVPLDLDPRGNRVTNTTGTIKFLRARGVIGGVLELIPNVLALEGFDDTEGGSLDFTTGRKRRSQLTQAWRNKLDERDAGGDIEA